jgi:hypothetical protein
MSLRLKLVSITAFGFLLVSAALYVYVRHSVAEAFTEFETGTVRSVSEVVLNVYRQ